jgi:hypothetical protein
MCEGWVGEIGWEIWEWVGTQGPGQAAAPVRWLSKLGRDVRLDMRCIGPLLTSQQ